MPGVSIIIPAYESHDTLAACLEGLRSQSWRDFEVIIVDSSASDRAQDILAKYPEVRVIRSECRLLPFAARKLGIQSARGEILVSTDPDLHFPSDWLERLIKCHRRTGFAVAGGVTCFGKRIFDWGAHFCKYHDSLPFGPAGPVKSAASANLLLPRKVYEAVGRVADDAFCSDYLFTVALVAKGFTLWFEPEAWVSHHHIVTWTKYVAERFARGKDFGRTRARTGTWTKLRILLWLLVSVFPVRLARLLGRTARSARRGRVLDVYLLALPVAAAGFAAWLAGEAAAYAEALLSRRYPESYPIKAPQTEGTAPNQGKKNG